MERKPTTIKSGSATVSVGLFREIYQYREMFWVLVWRDIRTRYAQSILGLGWAIFPAVSQALIYTLIFGRLVRLDSDGAPYSMFALVGVIPWIFFSQAFNAACSSVYGAGSFIQKIYFPRVFLPAAAILDKGFDFLVALCVTFIVLCFFGGDPNWNVVFLPLLILLIVVTTLWVWDVGCSGLCTFPRPPAHDGLCYYGINVLFSCRLSSLPRTTEMAVHLRA